MTKHQWECDNCGYEIAFRLPEFPEGHYRSEQNESKIYPHCDEDMFFDEIEERKLATPEANSVKENQKINTVH